MQVTRESRGRGMTSNAVVNDSRSTIILINPTIKDFMQSLRLNFRAIVDRKMLSVDVYFVGDNVNNLECIKTVCTLINRFDAKVKKCAVGYMVLTKRFPT